MLRSSVHDPNLDSLGACAKNSLYDGVPKNLRAGSKLYRLYRTVHQVGGGVQITLHAMTQIPIGACLVRVAQHRAQGMTAQGNKLV